MRLALLWAIILTEIVRYQCDGDYPTTYGYMFSRKAYRGSVAKPSDMPCDFDMSMRRAFAFLIFTFMFCNESADAQDPIQARQGRAFAQRTCATCHGIVPSAPSPVAGAPNFHTIATTPGMSPLALREALETPHHSMPNPMLSAVELRDIAAFIMSLQTK
jgi:mono/diheme cytochrome c family protein